MNDSTSSAAASQITVFAGDRNMIQVGHAVSGSQAAGSVETLRLQRRAAVAEQALIAALQYLDAMVPTALGVYRGLACTRAERFADNWQAIRSHDGEFLRARTLVHIHLGEIELGVMDEVWRFKGRLQALQERAVSGDAVAFGDHHAATIEALRSKAIAALQPYATFAQP